MLGRLVAAAALSLLLPGTAYAHGRLKSSLPAAGARLTQAPRMLRLDFSEAPDLTFSSVRLTSASGREIALGAVAYAPDSRRSMIATIAAALDTGSYTVSWQMGGDDGHPVRGRFSFTIASGATGVGMAPAVAPPVVPPSAAAGTADSTAMANMHHDPMSMPESDGFGSESPVYVLIRWVQFIGLVLVIGAVSFHAFVLATVRRARRDIAPPDELSMLVAAETRAAAIGRAAVVLVAFTLMMRLVAQGYAMHGLDAGSDPALMIPMLRSTMWGWGWILQLAGVIVAGIGFQHARGGRTDGRSDRGWLLAATGAVLLAFSPGMASHAASSPKLRALAMLADGVHVLGASCWLGTLALVLFAGVVVATQYRADSSAAFVRDLINAFSPVALVSAGVAASTGLFAAWLHVGTVPNLWGTRYGLTLLTKLAILGAVTMTGFYNWRFVKPRLGTPGATTHLRRSAMIEVGVAVLVLLVTAVLVALPTSMDMIM